MKTLIGKVVSTKMQKTVVVEVQTSRPHPLYKKIVKRKKRYKVDNEALELKVGDKVEIIEMRPISKEKKFKVLKKLEEVSSQNVTVSNRKVRNEKGARRKP